MQSYEVIQKELAKQIESLESLRDELDNGETADAADNFVDLATDLRDLVGELALIQSRARLDVIGVDTVPLKPRAALEIARRHRLDWMNNRAALVDTWRLIEFNANALKSDLSLRFDGDIQTLNRDNPFSFRDETGTLRLGLEFDPPFTRLVERNNFRQH